MTFPFKNKNMQRGWAIFLVIVGMLIMIVKSISNFVDNLGINAFITGLIIAFLGFFYLIDL